ncbi:MAG: phosphate acyltransferase PlsX [Gammaproteobacteria bacterium]|jgi:glycerol-3-phosphate acyltransferase PlsX|uniref:phosphate acyltransferase PlsX n=1 Tax=Nevskia sp. TaxID=1929292 RepID=UPI004036AE67|nr:phosphate acyltransferase PlsX [Gammaproteobacteria bacterium]
MTAPVLLALDAMSGDHGHRIVVDAALRALDEHPQLSLILVGDEAVLARELAAHRRSQESRIRLQHATQVVAMDELPSKALRGKKDSSMRVAVDLVKSGQAQAAVSAGNTGALMAIAKFVLKTLPGIDRPAIISPMPTVSGATHVLDLGANASCSAEQLFQFAVMGSALVTALHGVERPRVALLNIGEEEIKGNEMIKQAAVLIAGSKLHYTGFIEGDGIFLHPVDVVVCDGFVGNVALKAGEGVAKLVTHFMREEFTRDWLTKAVALIARSVLRQLARRMDPRRYNGASLVGLNGTVIKSHGGADALAFANAIEVALRAVQNNVPARIASLLAESLGASPTTSAAV